MFSKYSCLTINYVEVGHIRFRTKLSFGPLKAITMLSILWTQLRILPSLNAPPLSSTYYYEKCF